MSKDVMTPKQAAEYLGISKPTIYKLLRQRKVPARRLGYQWRISMAALDEFLRTEEERGKLWGVKVRRRSIDEVNKADEKLSKIIWWNEHKLLEKNKETMEREGKWKKTDKRWKADLEFAKQVEKEIPEEERVLDSLNQAFVHGKLSALAWFLGAEWDEDYIIYRVVKPR